MTDRAIRNLAHLRRSASTARVLNLLKVFQDHRDDPAWAERPIFRAPALNRSLILKHRLRRDEIDLFPLRRHVATKVVVPLDADDLKLGGRYVFVGQRDFARVVQQAFGIGPRHPDIATLRLLDELPSLDPFLLREQLKRGGVEPAPCYFPISESDLDRMLAFVEEEIRPLVTLSIGEDLEAVGSTRRLAGRILSVETGERMETLRRSLRLEAEDYQEGLFCWKGFLYYKWALADLTAEAAAVAAAVHAIRPIGKLDRASRAWFEARRATLPDRIVQTCARAAETIALYDDAYAGLTSGGRPIAFRDFLLDAPSLFTRLGDQLGVVQHIVSFWRFRFGPDAPPVSVEELIDIFADFEAGLAERESDAAPPAFAA